MSYSTMNQGGQSDSGYGGGKSAPSIQQPYFNKYLMPDNNYQGGPPKLDLSGMMPQNPQQQVDQSRANGGILKLRNQPQPFNPNPTPNPGFGGGKGLIQPIGGGGFGGGKSMPSPIIQPDVMPDYRSTDGAGNYTMDMQNMLNKTPTNTYGKY